MQFPVSKHALWTVSETMDMSTPVVSPTTCSKGKVQNMDPWSMDPPPAPVDPVHGPGPWTRFMDPVHGPPIFPTPKNIIENNKKIK